MNKLEPFNQQKLFGLDKHLIELIRLYETKKFPNKILLSGQKGIGKSTLAYHFINYVLSQGNEYKYDVDKFKINTECSTFRTIINKSNPNLIIVDLSPDKKFIDINQIRELVLNLSKSSFNNKPRFVLIDNIEFLNKNSINALLKTLEEPNKNIHFILINNNIKILPTLLSRCVNYRINLTNNECFEIANHLLSGKLENLINKDLINYYFTPGLIYNLIKFTEQYNYNLQEYDLKKFLKISIKERHYKKDPMIKYLLFHLMEFYLRKLNISFSKKITEKYSYFVRLISDTKTFNLDEESIFMEFDEDILNG